MTLERERRKLRKQQFAVLDGKDIQSQLMRNGRHSIRVIFTIVLLLTAGLWWGIFALHQSNRQDREANRAAYQRHIEQTMRAIKGPDGNLDANDVTSFLQYCGISESPGKGETLRLTPIDLTDKSMRLNVTLGDKVVGVINRAKAEAYINHTREKGIDFDINQALK